MRSLRKLRAAVLAAVLLAFAGAARAETASIPSWVPPQYAKFVVRYVDDRPTWQRALGYLNVSVGNIGRSFALIAGVSKYPGISGDAGDLWPARLDVEKMTAYLSGAPESFNEIVVLLDNDMTSENLRYFLTQYFPRRLAESPRSRFLFAYSGHGMTDEKGRGYLLTSQATSLTDWYDGISLAELRAEFQNVIDRGHQVLALINACYGAEFLSFPFGGDANQTSLPTREGAHAITAGSSGELTYSNQKFGDGDGRKGSIFFEAVLAALDGRADKLPEDGIVTVGELETYVRSTISTFTKEQQNPTGGDLMSTRSPGGFFFLDRNRQIDNHNATQLKGEWWGGLAFGGSAQSDQTAPAVEPPSDTAAASQQVASLEPGGSDLGALAGSWAGDAAEPGGTPFRVEIDVAADCAMNKACGTIAVPGMPCRGRITLIDSRAEGYEFSVDDFGASSDKSVCQPGAGEVVKPLPDGTLAYTATYSGAEGVLRRR